MENKILQEEILKNLKFLQSEHSYTLLKNENHWLGGVIIEYKKGEHIISILYDKRERWFVTKLFSFTQENKTHMYLVEELRKKCSTLQNQNIAIEKDAEILIFLKSFSNCLKNNFYTVLDNFEKGNYFGGDN
jgi:hypothetical protein